MSFTFRSICFLFCLFAVSTLVWNPNVGQGTSQLVIVEDEFGLNAIQGSQKQRRAWGNVLAATDMKLVRNCLDTVATNVTPR
jgi:hypothetical protein